MENIIEATMDYDFSKLYLSPPSALSGGSYFTRIVADTTNKPLFIQTPKCLTKQGFVKSGKKMFVDLMFDNNDTVFINWIENLEAKCQELIFAKRDNWFESKLEKDDIEGAFTSPFKIFKSGKYYLLRVNVKPTLKIFDESDRCFTFEEVSNDKHLISIIEIQGIKFTSRNFQIEIEMKQSMIVSPDPFLDTCFIKKPTKQKQTTLDELVDSSTNALATISKEPEPVIVDVVKEEEPAVEEEPAKEEEPVEEEPVEEEPPKEEEAVEEEPAVGEGEGEGEGTGEEEGENDESNIVFEIEELPDEITPTELTEINVDNEGDGDLETMTLKKPNQVYYEIYKKAREKAKEAKKNALSAYLEMKNIKKNYMLDDIDDSDSELDDFE